MAKVMGPESAAASALRDADSHDGPVTFYYADFTYIVEKHPKETTP